MFNYTMIQTMSFSIVALGFCLRFIIWLLKFIWDLEFVIWDFFVLQHIQILMLSAMGHGGISPV